MTDLIMPVIEFDHLIIPPLRKERGRWNQNKVDRRTDRGWTKGGQKSSIEITAKTIRI